MFIEVTDHRIEAGRVRHIHCETCGQDISPDPAAPDLGHAHGEELLRELAFQLENGLELCDSCGQGTYPGLGEPHACPHA